MTLFFLNIKKQHPHIAILTIKFSIVVLLAAAAYDDS
jgi:hypothetical protein